MLIGHYENNDKTLIQVIDQYLGNYGDSQIRKKVIDAVLNTQIFSQKTLLQYLKPLATTCWGLNKFFTSSWCTFAIDNL